MKYQTYEKYKDSGVEWIGKIPVNWEVKRLRYLVQITTGEKDTENREDNGEYPFFVRSQTVERISTFSFDGEAILTAGDGVGVCKVWHYVNGKFDFHQRVYMLFKFKKVTGKFLFYFLKELFIHEVLKLSAKSTVDSLRLHMFQNFPVAVPDNIQEQNTVVQFLDRETARIDALIDKKQQLIELLKEKRTALITRAVTKGLWALSSAETPPKMKDSGIQWLGEIPEHWEVKRMRYLVQITTGEKDTENKEDYGEYPFYVRSQTIERISTYSYDGEAILTAGDGVGVCKVWHHVNAKFDFHQRVYMLYKFRGVTGRFLFYFLKELFVHEVLKLSAKSTVDSLRLHMFQNFPVAVPNSIIEQRRIGDFLDAKTSKIDDLVLKVDHAIEKLREYRTALISAAVTGKVRVSEK